MSPAGADAAEEVWLLLQRFVETHSPHRAMADALGFGLGAGRGRVLTGLAAGPASLTDLAAAHGFDAPYTTLVVDKLQSHGLVERRPHPEDGRRKLVALTDAGRAALATVDDLRRHPPEAVAALSAADRRTLTAVLRRLVGDDA